MSMTLAQMNQVTSEDFVSDPFNNPAIHTEPVSNVERTARKKLGPLGFVFGLLKRIPFLGVQKILDFERDVQEMSTGEEVAQWWSDRLTLDLEVEGLEHIPAKGPMMFFGNHATGIGDGIATFDALKSRRDLKLAYLMNAQGLESTTAISDLAVPVKLKGGDRDSDDKDVLWQKIDAAVSEQRALFLFPAGRVMKPNKPWQRKLVEEPWKPGVITIPQRFPDMPVIPFRIEARNRSYSYWLGHFIPVLKDILLYTEFHTKKNAKYKVTFLPPQRFDNVEDARAAVLGKGE